MILQKICKIKNKHRCMHTDENGYGIILIYMMVGSELLRIITVLKKTGVH